MRTWEDVRTEPGLAIVQDTTVAGVSSWRLLSKPRRILTAREPQAVAGLLDDVEELAGQGLFAAGYVAYEAAPGFDAALPTRRDAMPPAWFGIYEQAEALPPPRSPDTLVSRTWHASMDAVQHAAAVERIKAYIAAGDTYQVNYCLRLVARSEDDPLAWFRQLCAGQRGSYAAYLDTGSHRILSSSPELFFRLDGDRITCRPMKGTSPRGLTWEDDQRLAEALQRSVKDRAENVMIVDMVRNDLGRIADTGTVEVGRLFAIERYPTVLQLTSTIQASTSASLADIFTALFPCASITGAPKVRTAHLIRELEPAARGIYTGAVGFVAPSRASDGAPSRRAQFNVAIRTVCVDTSTAEAAYGTGSGIVWDSEAGAEYQECLAKARVLDVDPRPFQLLETMLWRPESGFALLDLHLERLLRSAHYFGFPVDVDAVRENLFAAVMEFTPVRRRVRLLVDDTGVATVESSIMARTGPRRSACAVAIDSEPVFSRDPFLYHKTTRREVYAAAHRRHPDADDVLLWNERGEITESTTSNIVARFGRELVTPPVACGLLAGTLRERLVRRGRVREKIIARDELPGADAIYLVNSVRGWRHGRLVPAGATR
jgi:para-aminobenzoate synthetase/4-amino-4-deoxychorismate lyase